jgi:hypothetical protein
MKLHNFRSATLLVALILTFSSFGLAQKAKKAPSLLIQERNVRAELEFLAGDAMQGRGSGTQFEWISAQYLGSMMQQFGIEPGGEKDTSGRLTYIQTIEVTGRSFLQKLNFSGGAGGTFEAGRDLVILGLAEKQMNGEAQKLNFGDKPKAGAFVLVTAAADDKFQTIQPKIAELLSGGAKAVLIVENDEFRSNWANLAGRRISLSNRFGNVFILSKEAAAKITEGTRISISGEFTEPQKSKTWNAVGKITGTDKNLSAEVILLSAHLDHLGVRPNAPGDDKIFNGADDDASGCVAVLELARVLASGAKPKRTVYFAFFGSEEAGGHGSQFFVNNLGFPKEKLIANLQFEMLGRPDAKVKPEELWLTGYDRSNLGVELAKRGAKLVADPHPEENFFQRSDNYTLARQGVIAHTVSSFGLHKDYHQASDELKTIDYNHFTRAINSIVAPVRWLINSNFKPAWYEGKKP